MKITKFVHSCVLVEMPAPVSRTVLFDPGMMSEAALDVSKLQYLDDIVITHIHGDHLSVKLVKELVGKFPDVRITTTPEVIDKLQAEGIKANLQTAAPDGLAIFDSPHEALEPVGPTPQAIGVHFMDLFTHPGDSHSFHETKPVLALPVTAPWGSMVTAVNLALELEPRYIVPIHDWHWRDEAREQMYKDLASLFKEQGITFLTPKTGEAIVLEV